jgi:retinol-binding protein 3
MPADAPPPRRPLVRRHFLAVAAGASTLAAHALVHTPIARSSPATVQPGTGQGAGDPPSASIPLNTETHAAVITALLPLLRDNYVFPEAGDAMAAAISARHTAGEYNPHTDAFRFARAITDDMRRISSDKHMGMIHAADRPGGIAAGPQTPEEREQTRAIEALNNYGLHRVERLPGNIGYIDLRVFSGDEQGAVAGAAAMRLLAGTSAMIIDLRRAPGGSGATVNGVASYFFGDEPVHLVDNYFRPQQRTIENWTRPELAVPRYGPDRPLYILTSDRTFSAAEAFTFALQELGRAIVVGATTGGGGHNNATFPLPAGFLASIAIGNATSPRTGRGWEGTGVTPDIAVPAEHALPAAHRIALTTVLHSLGPQPAGAQRVLADEIRAALAGQVQ